MVRKVLMAAAITGAALLPVTASAAQILGSDAAACTSGGTFGLVASSLNGSPGASASTTNRTTEIPSRLGIAIIRRRRMY